MLTRPDYKLGSKFMISLAGIIVGGDIKNIKFEFYSHGWGEN